MIHPFSYLMWFHTYPLLKVLERAFISLVCAIKKLNVYNDRNRIGTFFVARGNYEVIDIIVEWSRDKFFRWNTFTFYFFSRVPSIRCIASESSLVDPSTEPLTGPRGLSVVEWLSCEHYLWSLIWYIPVRLPMMILRMCHLRRSIVAS